MRGSDSSVLTTRTACQKRRSALFSSMNCSDWQVDDDLSDLDAEEEVDLEDVQGFVCGTRRIVGHAKIIQGVRRRVPYRTRWIPIWFTNAEKSPRDQGEVEQ